MRLIGEDYLPKENKMQIKIDIPENVYYNVLHYIECLANPDFELLMIKAIKNGVLLPKSHGKLIDADVLKEQMIKYGFHAADITVTEFIEDVLPAITEADEEENE